MDRIREDVFEKNSEIIVAFFNNRFYNEIYAVAKDDFEKRAGRSLTDTYARYLSTYLAELESARDTTGVKVRDTVLSLCTYYSRHMHNEIPLDEFIDCVLGQIVPVDFYGSMGSRERNGVFCDLVKQVASGMGMAALKPAMMRRIIDDRAHYEIGTGIMHDIGMDIMRNYKASMVSKLYAKSEGCGTSRRVVAAERYVQMRDRARAILTQFRDMELRAAKLERDCRAMAADNAKLRAEIEEERANNKRTREVIAELRAQLEPSARAKSSRASSRMRAPASAPAVVATAKISRADDECPVQIAPRAPIIAATAEDDDDFVVAEPARDDASGKAKAVVAVTTTARADDENKDIIDAIDDEVADEVADEEEDDGTMRPEDDDDERETSSEEEGVDVRAIAASIAARNRSRAGAK